MNGDDLTVRVGQGVLNVRVGAIIERDGKLLMAGNPAHDYYYSVGGRIRFGESAEQAIVREVYEETGVLMTVDRLAAVHENFFTSDSGGPLKGLPVYEISFFFYMNVPDGFAPVCLSETGDGERESLYWVDPATPKTVYPEFFRGGVSRPIEGVAHFVTGKTEKTGKTDMPEAG